ncbi:ATP-binding cassette domain-containing protein [Calidifontibacter terrae]
MIDARNLTKVYDGKRAVDNLSFSVRPGEVTGFLGPNGAGKSTTMRMLLGLDTPTSGEALINGRPFHKLKAPLIEVGALLEAKAVHTSRSARNHLLALAVSNGIPARRVDEVLELVGLSSVARRRAGGFSLGMGQRLGIAAALLGDPHTLILDEPVNGLDPEGIQWMRHLLAGLAAEGRTVFVSSHLMSEMALMATRVVVIGQGRLIRDSTISEITQGGPGAAVLVRTPDAPRLASALEQAGGTLAERGSDSLLVHGLSSDVVGRVAFDQHVMLLELTARQPTLEEAFMELTRSSVEYDGREAS